MTPAATDLAALAERIRACVRCGGLVGSRPVPGAGPPEASLFFLAEAPGRFGAARTGVPLSGDRSGDLFGAMLRAHGLCRASVYISNVVHCNPLDGGGRNRAPRAGELAACDDHWRAELALVRPRLLVTLGAVSCLRATGRRLATARARLVPGPGVPVFALYHPAYVVRGGCSRSEYGRDWAALCRALEQLEGRGASPR